MPRFTVILEGMADFALFDALEITTDFYTIPPEELKENILDEMEWTFELWIERGLDREGPEETPCVSHIHDAISGGIGTVPITSQPLSNSASPSVGSAVTLVSSNSGPPSGRRNATQISGAPSARLSR